MKNMTSKKRKANLNCIRPTHTYTMRELANTLDIALSTVQRWKRLGMPVIPETNPVLIDGAEAKQWEKARRLARKRPCAPNQFYCFGAQCRTQRQAAIGSVIIRKSNSNLGSIEGICPICDSNLRKGFAMKDVFEVEATFEAYIGNVLDLLRYRTPP
ncbi:MAG: hypothetical protein COA91_06560 [Robiginitomaculum sp.]|nr:MAG: hypothetical protein COA91_06560 [Robiginitomaculum sp.]